MVDLRPYAERIARAWPERFTFCSSDTSWWIESPNHALFLHEVDIRLRGIACAWLFIGPLLDELEVEAYTLYDCEKPTWLEAAFAAVAAELEKKKGGGRGGYKVGNPTRREVDSAT